jgi:hypothetical protein
MSHRLEDKIRRVAEERGVTPCQALFAVFLASLAEARILNQATVNFLAKNAAPKLYAYMKAMGLLPEPTGNQVEDTRRLIEAVNKALEAGPEPVVETPEPGVLLVGIGGSKCRYCPRGVGLAEIPWTACPFPRLIEGMLRAYGVEARLETVEEGKLVARREGLCWLRLRLGALGEGA